jgi:hypothetical protein
MGRVSWTDVVINEEILHRSRRKIQSRKGNGIGHVLLKIAI